MIVKDCQKRIYKSLGSIVILLFALCILLAILYTQPIISLFQGAKEFSLFEEKVINKDKIDTFHDLKNEYIDVEVKTIIGSYAEYGNQKDDGMERESVYYLMPIQDGTYFISIIANKESISQLDNMEKLFQKNIGSEEKIYPETYHIQGGFVSLSDEEKAYAFEFFEGFDENVKDVSQLSQILSPYAIHIGEIGNTSIRMLWIILCILSILSLLCIIIAYVIYKKILLKDIMNYVNALNDIEKGLLEEDYKKAQVHHDVLFGKKFLYKKERFSYEILPYEEQIWMYKEQCANQRVITYQIQVYNKEGKVHQIYKNSEEAVVESILTTFFDHCQNAVLGYQFSLHVTAMDSPDKLHKKVRDLLYLTDDKKVKKVENKKQEENLLQDKE